MTHLGRSDMLAGVGYQRAGGGTFSNGLLRLQGTTVSDISASCCTELGLPVAIAAESLDEALVSYSGSFFVTGGVPRVMRRSGGGYTNTNWPAAGGPSSEHIEAMHASGGGVYLALSSEGRVFRYANMTWTELGNLNVGTANYTGQGLVFDSDELVGFACSQGDAQAQIGVLRRWKAGVLSTLPAPPGSCATQYDTRLSGRTLSTMLALTPSGLFGFDGTDWDAVA